MVGSSTLVQISDAKAILIPEPELFRNPVVPVFGSPLYMTSQYTGLNLLFFTLIIVSINFIYFYVCCFSL
jgi:hypothetical protein